MLRIFVIAVFLGVYSSSSLASAESTPGARVVAALASADRFHFSLANQMRRHPICSENIRAVIESDSMEQAVMALITAVHECGHALDDERSRLDVENPKAHFAVSENIQFTCKLELTDASGRAYNAADFPVNKINQDQFAAKRPICKNNERKGCDWYASTYLKADMGQQGLDFVLEELTQYLHSLETAIALKQYLDPEDRLSAQDGLLTFMWYLQRYLAVARQQNPLWYAVFMKDDCWSKLTVSLWHRAQQQLATIANDKRLGIDAEALAALIANPVLSREIQILRHELARGEGRNPASKSRR